MQAKSEDQIQKDKEAVAKMRSARSAMEASIRRVETLERALNEVQEQVNNIRKAYSEDLYIKIYVPKHSDYEPVKVRDIFHAIDSRIKNVL